MTDNEKLLKWKGFVLESKPFGSDFKKVWAKNDVVFFIESLPDYRKDELFAFSLLDRLVANNYDINLMNVGNSWFLSICKKDNPLSAIMGKVFETRSEAIADTILRLIDKGE